LIDTLIISEKADAGRRIAYFLSDGKSKQKKSKGLSYIQYDAEVGSFYLVPLSGHIVEIDFPKEMKDWKLESLHSLIDSKVIHNVKNKTAYESLRSLSSDVKRIIIATDYDREGELIGTEALDIILKENKFKGEIRRAKFSALTGKEIKDAFSNVIDVDYNLSSSAATREEIDLYWGAALTRFFSLITNRLGKNFLSIGRVQTPTLGIIVKREREIENFKPEKFWEVKVDFLKDEIFTGTNEEGRLKDEKKAKEIFEKVKGKNGIVKEFNKSLERIYKPAPFNTTEFMREASRIGVMPSRAMKIAESLYVKGYISYPRTDNTVYQRSINLKTVVEKLKNSDLKKEAEMVLGQEKIIPSRGKMEAMDHPPIYPTEVPKKDSLRADEAKVYELIARRFLATLYREGHREVRNATISIEEYGFKSNGSKVTDQGWLEIYTYRKFKDIFHPDLEIGKTVKAEDWRTEEGETKPPSRYDMASLIKEMENLNLGTKSTRHDIIEKLQNRGFIEGNPVRPTALGSSLIDGVNSVDSKISEPYMTAELEGFMNEIALGQKTKVNVVNESRSMLSNVLDELNKNKETISMKIRGALETGVEVGICNVDGTKIQAIKIRDSIRFKCEVDNCTDFYQKIRGLIKPSEKNCPQCSRILVTVIRRGQSPDTICIDPLCKFNTEKKDIGLCPRDGGHLLVRQSRYGKRFLGCSNFPKCTQTYALPQKGDIIGTGKTCELCKAPILQVSIGTNLREICPNLSCESNKKQKTGEEVKSKTRAYKKPKAKRTAKKASTVGKKRVKVSE
jgi:DNA topoisomerase-1